MSQLKERKDIDMFKLSIYFRDELWDFFNGSSKKEILDKFISSYKEEIGYNPPQEDIDELTRDGFFVYWNGKGTIEWVTNF